MKTLYLIPLLGLVGCAQLMHGQPPDAPRRIDIKTPLYFTDCSGVANDFGGCYDAAGKTCPNGYDVVEKIQTSRAIDRSLKFLCK